MDTRWIIVRDRQAGLLAEAEARHLARDARRERRDSNDGYRARIGLVADRAVLTWGALFGAARVEVGRRLIGLGAALAAEPQLSGECDCAEA